MSFIGLKVTGRWDAPEHHFWMIKLEELQPRGLEPVSLTVETGTCLALYGASGAGKTLLLRAIADLDENTGDAKTSRIRRSAVRAPEWRRAVTYVPAESGWWADRVGDHLADTARCHELLSQLGLPRECLSWDIGRLSTGEKQRLALVRALLCEPEVLLLDEPTAALDPAATGQVEAVLSRSLAKGLTMLFVSHDPEQATRLNAGVGTIRNGKLDFESGASAR